MDAVTDRAVREHKTAALQVERCGSVSVVRVANPPLNLLTRDVLEQLEHVFASLDADRDCRAVVLTGGVEGVFLTHLDIGDMLDRPVTPRSLSPRQASFLLAVLTLARRSARMRRGLAASALAGPSLLLTVHDLLERIQRSSMVTIAALNGSAIGPGFDIALAFDVRLAADGPYVFGMPETTLGGISGGGATQRLTRLLGPARSFELMLEGSTLSPTEAKALGVVNGVEPADRLIACAVATATRLARRSPRTIAALKRAVYESASRSLRNGLREERAEFIALLSGAEVHCALEAFAAECRPDEGISPWLNPQRLERWQRGNVVHFSR